MSSTASSGVGAGAGRNRRRARSRRVATQVGRGTEVSLGLREGDGHSIAGERLRWYPPNAPWGDHPTVRDAAPGYHRRMATLSRAEVEHVAHLARLGLADEELTRLENELNHILDQYAILVRLDTEAIPPTAQTIELENILREDDPRPSLPREAILANAAESEGGFIVVPAILGPDPT
jgi:aspartyl-tRNA(Asn)/glutamyl-tRNA(Gln) amidotransferase subunit C